MSWVLYTNSFFAQCWVTYTLSFERVLAQWEAGNFDQIRPGAAPPFGGQSTVISEFRFQPEQRFLLELLTQSFERK